MHTLSRCHLHSLAAAVAIAILGLFPRTASAEDVVKVAKSVPNPLAFAVLDIGNEAGIWAKHGLKLEIMNSSGDAKMQQAMVAGEIDFGLGSGPGMGFLAKGVPATVVGVVANQPLSMGLIIGKNSKARTVSDIKGTKIGVSTNASLSYWLARKLSELQGWGPNGVRTVPLGALPSNIAALQAGQVEGFIMSASVGHQLQRKKEGRLLLRFGDYIGKFYTHLIFASNRIIEKNPDLVKQFVQGWSDTVKYMKENKADTVRFAKEITGYDDDIQSDEYDDVMPMMSVDMKFDKQSSDVVAESLIDLQISKEKLDLSKFYTERFLPTVN
jgi:ABC-type nitrate/sulfonate/bicarbonate transport system substrate-binding protein